MTTDSNGPEEKPKPRSGKWVLYGIIGAIVLGAAVGGFAPKVGVGLKLLGDMFLNALMMLVVPLVMVSIVSGITSLGDVRRLGALGWRTLGYYLITTALALIVGIVLVNVVRPGVGVAHGEELPEVGYEVVGDTVKLHGGTRRTTYDERFALRLLDQDIVGKIVSAESDAITVSAWTDAEGRPATPAPNGAGISIDVGVAEKVKGKKASASEVLAEVAGNLLPRNIFQAMAEGRVLPLIVFSLLFGGVLTTLGERGRPVVRFFRSLNEAIMRLVGLVMMVAPIGILGLIAARIGQAGGFAGFLPELAALGKYAGTVVVGLLFHGIVTLPLLLWLVGKRRPGRYARNVAPALLNAFATASSSATLPLTMECVEEGNGISNRTASFVLPLGATINMDGTALYEAVAAIFIAQAFGIELSFGHMVIIFLTATLASIGAAGIPEAGLVTMLIVLNAVGLPVAGVALILTIDWLLDRFRTTVNVWGDAAGSAIIERLEGRARWESSAA